MQTYSQYLKLYEKLDGQEFENICQTENLSQGTKQLTSNITQIIIQSNKKTPISLQKLQK